MDVVSTAETKTDAPFLSARFIFEGTICCIASIEVKKVETVCIDANFLKIWYEVQPPTQQKAERGGWQGSVHMKFKKILANLWI